MAALAAAFANHLSLITRRHLCLQSTFWACDHFRHALLNHSAFLIAREGKAEPEVSSGEPVKSTLSQGLPDNLETE
jgi:hypothetical protein